MRILLTSLLLLCSLQLYAGNCCHYTISPDALLFTWGSGDQLEVSNIDLNYSQGWGWSCWFINCKKVYVDFDRGQSSSYNRIMTYNSTSIHYNIYKRSTIQTPLTLKEDATNVQNYFRPRLRRNRTKTIKVYGKLPIPNQNTTFFPKGIYNDSVTIRIYPRTNGQNEITTASLPVKLFIPPVLELSLVDSGAPFDPNDTSQTLEFGTLHQNDTKNFDIKVKSNAGYSISFSSLNNGHLKNVSHPDMITYTTKVNGITHSLAGSSSTPVEVANQNGITSQTGATIHVAITIGDVANKHFGQYQDTVTVTAMTLD